MTQGDPGPKTDVDFPQNSTELAAGPINPGGQIFSIPVSCYIMADSHVMLEHIMSILKAEHGKKVRGCYFKACVLSERGKKSTQLILNCWFITALLVRKAGSSKDLCIYTREIGV